MFIIWQWLDTAICELKKYPWGWDFRFERSEHGVPPTLQISSWRCTPVEIHCI